MSTAGLFERLTSLAISWEGRLAAERALMEQPASVVVPLLLPAYAKGMPPGPIWNSGGPEIDRDAPSNWQVFYAVARVWDHHFRKAQDEDLARLLLKLLESADQDKLQRVLLREMVHHWVEEAEKITASLLRGSDSDEVVRLAAASCLSAKLWDDYIVEILAVGEDLSLSGQARLLDILSLKPDRTGRRAHPGVVRFGFALLEQDDADGSLLLIRFDVAIVMERILKVRFHPEQGDYGDMNDYYRDTVKNALGWWEKRE